MLYVYSDPNKQKLKFHQKNVTNKCGVGSRSSTVNLVIVTGSSLTRPIGYPRSFGGSTVFPKLTFSHGNPVVLLQNTCICT